MKSTIRFMYGSSGVGKSTRLYILFRFFSSLEKPNVLLIDDVPMGYSFKKHQLSIIGKENIKPTGKTFQGLDAFIGKLGNFEQQYNKIYEYCESHPGDLIVESVMSMSTHRTGPQYILENGFNVAYNSEFFVYPSFEAFRKRVADRGGRQYEKEEDAKIWLKNKQYLKKYGVFQSEITDPTRFILNKFSYDDDVDLFAIRFLNSTGKSELVHPLLNFLEEEKRKEKESLKKKVSLF